MQIQTPSARRSYGARLITYMWPARKRQRSQRPRPYQQKACASTAAKCYLQELRHRQMKIELSRRVSADEGSATCSHPGRARRKASNSHRLDACLQERQHLTIRSLRDPSRPRQGQDVATVEIPSATPEHTSHCHCCNRGARVKRLAMSPIASAVAHSRFALLGSRAQEVQEPRQAGE